MSRLTTSVRVGAVVISLLSTAAWAEAEQAKPTPAVNGVTVTVKYTGKGTVDANHKLWVWLFDNPNIGPGAIPIAEMSLDKNGTTAAFAEVAAKQVYVAVAYDENGGFAGQAPPPPGSPIAMYGVKSADAQPAPVTPGPKAAVTITFADTQRMQ